MDLQKILNQGNQQLMLSEQVEDSKYRIENVSVNISSTFHQLNFENCTFEATETSVAIILAETQQTQKCVTFMFVNMSSVGLQEGPQNEDEDQDQGEQNPMPQVFKLIQNESEGTFNLNGNFTVALDFKSQQQSKKKDIHDFLVGYLESNQNEEDDQNFMDEMISADQINEDGTINNFNPGEEDEDEESGDQEDKMEEENKKW